MPKQNVKKVLRKIYDFNVCKFKNATMGALNGMMPNGTKDRTSMQSEEVWTGVTYALASLMAKEVSFSVENLTKVKSFLYFFREW